MSILFSWDEFTINNCYFWHTNISSDTCADWLQSKLSILEGPLEVIQSIQSRLTSELLWLQFRVIPFVRSVWQFSPVTSRFLHWAFSGWVAALFKLLTCIYPSHLDCERWHLRDKNWKTNSHHRRCRYWSWSGKVYKLLKAVLKTAKENISKHCFKRYYSYWHALS